MFRHKGKARRPVHNLRLAALLSFVAGIVNVTGFFSVKVLTTNVTGHFAYFADDVIKRNFENAGIFLLYILAYLSGAFVSNTLVEATQKVNPRYTDAVPVFTEIVLLTGIALLPGATIQHMVQLVAGILLFAMGLQNAMVTRISNAVVRTTHLTGLFTDLGIELSQLLFYRKPEHRKKLKASVRLRFAIIGFFFLGCVAGGIGFTRFHTSVLFLAIAILFTGIIYSGIRYRILLLKKNLSVNKAGSSPRS